jgi:hypothetical protein
LMMMMIAVMVCSILWWLPMPSSRMYSTVHVMKAQKKRMMTYLHHRGGTRTQPSQTHDTRLIPILILPMTMRCL